MKTNLLKRKEGRPLSSKFLRLFSLLVMLVVGMSTACAQVTITEFTIGNLSYNSEDRYYLGRDNNVDYFSLGLNRESKVEPKSINSVNYYFLPNWQLSDGYFKIQFPKGIVKAGDILSVDCTPYWGGQEIGYKVAGTDKIETSGASVESGTIITISHTVQESEIVTEDEHQYIRIYKLNSQNTAYNHFKITREFSWSDGSKYVSFSNLNTKYGESDFSQHTCDWSTYSNVCFNLSELSPAPVYCSIVVVKDGSLVEYKRDFWSPGYKDMDLFTFKNSNGEFLNAELLKNAYDIRFYGNATAGSARIENVALKTPVEHPYNIVAVDVDNKTIKSITSGSTINGCTAYFPLVVEQNGIYYKLAENTTSYVLNIERKSSAGTDVKTVKYKEDPFIVAYVEGESYQKESENSNRSNGWGGHIEGYKNHTTGTQIGSLNPGNYTFVANVYANSGRELVVRNAATGDILARINANGTQNSDFSITEQTNIILTGRDSDAKTNQSADFDYAYIARQECTHTVTTGTIGATDNTSAWWTCFSPFYSIANGETRIFTFTNFGSTGENFYNWNMFVVNEPNHNGDTNKTSNYKEYIRLRADRWDEIAGNANNMTWTTSDGNLWGGFQNDMTKADVEMLVSRNGNTLTMQADMTGKSGRVYQLTYTKQITEVGAGDPLYLFFTIQNSHIENFKSKNTIDINMSFNDQTPSTTVGANGSAAYEQQAVGVPVGVKVNYTIIGQTGSVVASLQQDEFSSDYTLTVSGRGTVTVQAECFGNIATYTLAVSGLMFEEPAPIIAHNITSYTPTLAYGETGASFELRIDDTTPELRGVTVNPTTGEVTNIPTGMGGVIIVRATKGGAIAEFCLTVAYDLNVWDIYHDPLDYGTIVEGTSNVNYNGQEIVRKNTPGSAHSVIKMDASHPYTNTNERVAVNNLTDYNSTKYVTDKVKANRVNFNAWIQGGDGETKMVDQWAKENFFNDVNMHVITYDDATIETVQKGYTQKDYDLLRRHWAFVYKTDKMQSYGRYVNEPLFAYKRAVKGDNGRIVKQTAGLWFDCASKCFGVSDNDVLDNEGGTVAVREQDRCVLFKSGNTFTIPRVKVGRYVKIHWYRHSTNSGDKFKVTNAIDLDGKAIPEDAILRFTGSHYYNEHKGATIFKVAEDTRTNYIDGDGDKCSDVKIECAINGWTEIYRVEIMETYVTEQQLCEVEVIPIPEGKYQSDDKVTYYKYATLDNWNSRDLNDQSAYNRKEHNMLASRLVSRIKTKDKGAVREKYGPEFYISGYAGQCFTWNGWQNTTLTAEPEAGSSASCSTMMEKVAVGNRIGYPMFKVYDIEGTGAVKLTFRTFTGDKEQGEPEYCLNKMEAWVAFGEYSVQEYPYTWDFTKYNMNKPNAHDNYQDFLTLNKMSDSDINTQYQYGSWNVASNKYVMEASEPENREVLPLALAGQNKQFYYIGSVSGGNDGRLLINDADTKVRNKRFFAQGSQLTLGDNAALDNGTIQTPVHTVLETEGLRINIDAVDDVNDGDIFFSASNGGGSKQRKAAGTWEETSLTVNNGTITVPEVDKDMYVFIRADKEPSSVIGAIKMHNGSNPNQTIYSEQDNFTTTSANVDLLQKELIDGKTWVYKVTGENVIGNSRFTLTNDYWGVKSNVGSIDVTTYPKAKVEFEEDTPSGINWCVEVNNNHDHPTVAMTSGRKIQEIDLKKVAEEHGVSSIDQVYIQKSAGGAPVSFTIKKFVLVDKNQVEHPIILNNKQAADNVQLNWADVIVTPQEDTKIEAIGVTNEFKMMTNADGWASESRKLRIDYNETETFTKHKLKAYIAKSTKEAILS